MLRELLKRVGRWLVVAGLALLSLRLFVHAAVVADSYPIAKLDPERSGPLVVLDQRGEVLRSRSAPDGRRSPWARVAELPPIAVDAVLAAEDARFFEHPGVDLLAVARALWLDLRAGKPAFGASTITMQLVRMTEHPNAARTWRAKLHEALLALRLERVLTKRQILEQYLNRAYFGYGAYGLQSAAQRFFGKPARGLSDAEATALAVLPRSPARYDLLRHLPLTLIRRNHVLTLLVAHSKLTQVAADELRMGAVQPHLTPWPFAAPHFCDWLLTQLSAERLARGGVLHSTLDLRLQQTVEAGMHREISQLNKRGVHDGGIVVLDAQRGQVSALVGSPNYGEAALDIATWRRHPGSALKPFVYGLALERGLSPASPALDIHEVPSQYRVRRLTQPERGPLPLRQALAGSLNLAAIHVLETVGVAPVLAKLAQAGIGPLPGSALDYGLRLALGAPKVRLLDVAAAYGFLVRGGKVAQPVGIVQLVAQDGSGWHPPRRPETQLFSAATAWQVMDMLADSDARRAVFGQDLPLDLPFAVAVKTGTSRGFSDTVAIGATQQWIVGAWAGNFDGSPTHGALAMATAAPLLRMALLKASAGKNQTLPVPPAGLHEVAVCALSGQRTTADCPHTRIEALRSDQRPLAACAWHGRDSAGRQAVHWPAEAQPWAHSHRGWTVPTAPGGQ